MALGPDGQPPHSAAHTQAARWLSSRHQTGVLIGGACAGTFVLGEAGLLDRRRCTTTWWLHHVFKQRFPAAFMYGGSAQENKDGIITTGGPLSGWTWRCMSSRPRPAGAGQAGGGHFGGRQPAPAAMLYAPRGFVNTANPLFTGRANHPPCPPRNDGGGAGPGIAPERARTAAEQLTVLPEPFITACVSKQPACCWVRRASASSRWPASGYGDETAFRRAFIQAMGLTPVVTAAGCTRSGHER
jgi:hypothetical protein